MIIQIGTEVDESRILWKYKESDEWKRTDIDDLIRAYEDRPKGEWIPVSERLPEDGDKVLTTYIVNGDTKEKFVETAMHYTIGEESCWWSPWDEHRIPELRIEVVAWQPLPESYKGGDTE